MIYEPEEDSFLLAKYVKQYARGKVLDMGCGSCVQAEAALSKTKNITAVDINPEAVALAKKKGFTAIKSDLFENVKGKYNLIIFNPPYLPEDSEEDSESKLVTTGGKKGNEVLERFLKDAKEHLALNGNVLVIASSLTPNVDGLFAEYGYEFRLLEIKNLFFEKLFVYLLF